MEGRGGTNKKTHTTHTTLIIPVGLLRFKIPKSHLQQPTSFDDPFYEAWKMTIQLHKAFSHVHFLTINCYRFWSFLLFLNEPKYLPFFFLESK